MVFLISSDGPHDETAVQRIDGLSERDRPFVVRENVGTVGDQANSKYGIDQPLPKYDTEVHRNDLDVRDDRNYPTASRRPLPPPPLPIRPSTASADSRSHPVPKFRHSDRRYCDILVVRFVAVASA